MMSHDDSKFVAPDRRPLSEAEWQCIIMMRSVTGGRLPVVTLKLAQKLQMLLKEGAG